MGSNSKQENAATNMMNEQNQFRTDLSSGKYKVDNPFTNYSDPFSYKDTSNKMNEIFGLQEKNINRQANDDIAENQADVTARMASRGLTGGSVVDSTLLGVATNIGKNRNNVLSQLRTNQAQSESNLMDTFNRNKLATTQAGLNVDLNNNRNVLSSLLSSYGLSQNLLNAFDDTTAVDDILGLVKTGAQSAGGISELISALSDRRFKENIIKTGEVNGINVYEFSYLGSPKRYSGVMADEVPQAVNIIGGIRFVNYSKLPGIIFNEV